MEFFELAEAFEDGSCFDAFVVEFELVVGDKIVLDDGLIDLSLHNGQFLVELLLEDARRLDIVLNSEVLKKQFFKGLQREDGVVVVQQSKILLQLCPPLIDRLVLVPVEEMLFRQHRQLQVTLHPLDLVLKGGMEVLELLHR
jgi:hypothetical protein